MDEKVKNRVELAEYDLETAGAKIDVREFKRFIESHFDISPMFLLGSYAHDTSLEHSEIDVPIIVNTLSGDYFATAPLLWDLRRQINDRIEPIIVKKDNDKGGFIDEIIKYGIEIQ